MHINDVSRKLIFLLIALILLYLYFVHYLHDIEVAVPALIFFGVGGVVFIALSPQFSISKGFHCIPINAKVVFTFPSFFGVYIIWCSRSNLIEAVLFGLCSYIGFLAYSLFWEVIRNRKCGNKGGNKGDGSI